MQEMGQTTDQRVGDGTPPGCPRCQNLMVREVFVDFESDCSPASFSGWRCVICGAILDPLILRHQAERPMPTYRRARVRKGGLFIERPVSPSRCLGR